MSKHLNLPSENALWSIINELPVGIYMKDVDCKFTYVNLHAAKSLGLERQEEALGKTDVDFFNADQAKKWSAQERRIMALEEDMVRQKELELWVDGRRRWVVTSKLPMRAPDGTVLGLFGITEDVTESERINLAVTGAREGLWYRALNSDEVWYSPHWKQMLGYTDEELPNLRGEFKKQVHPEDWARVEKACDAHVHHGAKYYECCFRMRHKNGTYRWIRSRGMLTRDESNKPQIFAGSHADITDSQDYESFYLKVLDTIPALIFVKDSNLRFVFVNEAVAKIFNKPKGQIIGKTDGDLNANKDQVNLFVNADKTVIATKRSIDIPEEVLTDARGNKRTLKTKKLPLIYPGTQDTHVLGIATDISDLKSTREDLRKTLSLLAEAVTDIEKSGNEASACELTLLHVGNLGYPSAMLSFVREDNGSLALATDTQHATGKFVQVAGRSYRPFDVSEPGHDLSCLVLAERRSRFIPDPALDAECDVKPFTECGITSQYIVPIATDSHRLGTLQVDLGSETEKPETVCKMFDALAAHLSIVIEHHRVRGRLEAVNNDLTNQARIVGFETAAGVILHDLNHSIADYAKLLNKVIGSPDIRHNKTALEFLLLTQRRITQWIDSVQGNVDKVRTNEEHRDYKVDDIVKEIVNVWQHKANARNCKLKGAYRARDATVRLRAGTLKDLLSCLVINAIEANARQIEIATDITPKAGIPGNMKNMVEIVVSDDGDGIPEEFKTKIYEFGWSSKGGVGHGMGLTVVDLLSKSLGGTAVLRSSGKSAGETLTKFAILIPCM